MKKTFEFRLFPTKAQRTKLNRALELCCWVYNETLATRKDAWEHERQSISRYDTIKMLPQWKSEKPELTQVYSQVLQDVCTRVDLAFQGFFRRVKAGQKPGYPRFKGRNHYKSFTYPQSGFSLENNILYLSRIGYVKIKVHRPAEGKVKTLTIRRDILGNWYACFSCAVEFNPLPASALSVGIDIGLTHFATLSHDEKIDNPRFFKQDEKALAKAQRRLSESKKGSADFCKRKRVVQYIHQRIKNRRKDFAHKLSRKLVNNYQIIALEDLDIAGMMDGNWRNMNKSISDVAWGQFVRFTKYKAEEAGRTCIQVDPYNTTQMCSNCGRIVKKDLSVRIHDCPYCGLVLDRDHNAALNILARGLSCMGKNP